jgi:hypothetical protein
MLLSRYYGFSCTESILKLKQEKNSILREFWGNFFLFGNYNLIEGTLTQRSVKMTEQQLIELIESGYFTKLAKAYEDLKVQKQKVEELLLEWWKVILNKPTF